MCLIVLFLFMNVNELVFVNRNAHLKEVLLLSGIALKIEIHLQYNVIGRLRRHWSVVPVGVNSVNLLSVSGEAWRPYFWRLLWRKPREEQRRRRRDRGRKLSFYPRVKELGTQVYWKLKLFVCGRRKKLHGSETKCKLRRCKGIIRNCPPLKRVSSNTVAD